MSPIYLEEGLALAWVFIGYLLLPLEEHILVDHFHVVQVHEHPQK